MAGVELPAGLITRAGKGELILVVGSGASIAATGDPTSAASWSGLLRHGATYALDQGLLSEADAGAAQTLLAGGQYQVVASLIKAALQSNRADWLNEAFSSLAVRAGNERLYRAIDGVPASHLATTNYDDLLEVTLGRAPVAWTAGAFAQALGEGRYARKQVLHIHGYYAEDSSVILDAADYTRLEQSTAMAAFAAAAATRSLLFVGCGPDGLKDQHFSQLWSWLEALGTANQHYALLPSSIDAPAARATTGSSIRFLRYDDTGLDAHDALPAALEELAAKAGATSTKWQEVGRAVVNAPLSPSVERRVVLVEVEDFDHLTNRPETAGLRQNLIDRLQRLLARETRGADLCVVGTRLERSVFEELGRHADAPVLAVLDDGIVGLADTTGLIGCRELVAGVVVDMSAETPRLTIAPAAPKGPTLQVVHNSRQFDGTAIALSIERNAIRVVGGKDHWGPQAAARKRRKEDLWEVITPAGTDTVVTLDIVLERGESEVISRYEMREVLYGLGQAGYARHSRAIEGTAALTSDVAQELHAMLERLAPAAFSIVRRDLENAMRTSPDGVHLRHIAAPVQLRSAREALYEATVDDGEAQGTRLEILPWVRPSLRRPGDASASLAIDDRTSRRLLVAATLGEFNREKAARTFSRQRTLLAFVAEQHLRLTYTLVSRESARHDTTTDRHFLIHCFGGGRNDSSSVAQSLSAAAAVQSAFHNSYGISYSTAVAEDLHDAEVASGDAEGYSRVRVVSTAPGWTWPVSDYGLIADYIRTLPGEVAVTWECSGDLTDITSVEPTPGTPEPLTLQVIGVATSPFDELRRLASDPAFAARSVALRCSVSVRGVDDNATRLAHEVGTLVGTEVFGSGQFTIDDSLAGGYTAVATGHALLAMHAPFGEMYATSYDTGRRYSRALKDQQFESGITLGTASRKAADGDYPEQVTLSELERFHHVHVVGRPGVGKTTLLKRMILGDLHAGNGVTIVDPHGGLADWAVEHLPSHRDGDVVLIDLDNKSFAPVLNPLDVDPRRPDEFGQVVSEVIHFIESRNFHQWSGPVFEQLTRLALLSMRDSSYPAAPALTELSLLLANQEIRKAIGARLHSEELRDGWRLQGQQGQQHYAEVLQWVIAKFDELTKDPTLRTVFGGASTTLDIASAVQQGKVLVFKLSSTRISEQAADFIGAMLLTALQQQLLDLGTSRDRPPHFVYIDEFHRFATLGLERLVVEARKFRVGMTLAHQNLSQLSAFQQHTGRFHEGVPSTLVGNAGTLVVFPVSSYDRDQLSRELGCSPDEIGRLARFQALVRTAVTSGSIQPFTLEIDDMGEPDASERLARLSGRMRSGGVWRPMAEVLDEVAERHAELRRWSQASKITTGSTSPPDEPATPRSAGSGSFLDEWLEKRQKAEQARGVDDVSADAPPPGISKLRASQRASAGRNGGKADDPVDPQAAPKRPVRRPRRVAARASSADQPTRRRQSRKERKSGAD